jgi:histidinol-phosphate aminotransferase
MAKLRGLGFEMSDTKSNFIFAKHPTLSGEKIYSALRQRGIVVRHFSSDRICQYNRITVGTREQMDALLGALEVILKEEIK